jgi:AcrR family transcriptional regulator
MSDVKPRPGQARRDRAKATRAAILDAAYRLFSEQGYAPTTMEAIAAESGVAVQTVYYVFRTKAALLKEVVETVAAGEADPAPVAERAWMREASTSPDGRRTLALTVEHGVDIYARVAPLDGPTIQAAAVDPDIDDYWRGVARSRRGAMERLIAHLAEITQLRSGLDLRRATDILFAVNSHETFLALSRDAGWSLPEYKAWLYETLSHQLLDVDDSAPHPTGDLSFHELLRGR